MYMCVFPPVGMLFSMANSLPSSVSGGAMVMGALGVTGKSPVTTSISNNNGNGGGGNGGGGNREQVNVNRIIKIILSLVKIRPFRT